MWTKRPKTSRTARPAKNNLVMNFFSSVKYRTKKRAIPAVANKIRYAAASSGNNMRKIGRASRTHPQTRYVIERLFVGLNVIRQIVPGLSLRQKFAVVAQLPYLSGRHASYQLILTSKRSR